MEYNVSQLLKSAVGTRREYPVDGTVARVDETRDPAKVAGQVEFVRTNDGILTRLNATLQTAEECSRCLSEFRAPVKLTIEEEFFPTVDVASGTPLPPPREPDAFLIDHNHVINLEDAIREYAVAARPMQPLCREDCRGLCPECGENLNERDCGHQTESTDPRWAALGRWAEREEPA